MGEDFRLKWNDHHSVFFSAAESLCHGDHLTDVTLSTGDREFSAHKLVLSICSNYFNGLFTPRPENKMRQRRPADGAAIVYLKDVDSKHLELLLSYMYRGEINVEENELMDLLATAKSLQIKGLTEAEDETKPEPNQSAVNPNQRSSSQIAGKKRPAPKPSSAPKPSTSTYNPAPHQPQTSSGSAAKKIKEESYEVPAIEEEYNEPEDEASNEVYLEDEDNAAAMLETQEDYNLDASAHDDSMPAAEGDPNNPGTPIQIGQGLWGCPFCQKVSKRAFNIKTHILVHTGEKPFPCPDCDLKCTTKANLQNHQRNMHNNWQ